MFCKICWCFVVIKARMHYQEQCPSECNVPFIFLLFEFLESQSGLPIFLHGIHFAGSTTHQGPVGHILMTKRCCRAPLSQKFHHLRISLVTNKSPAFLVAHLIVFRRCRPVLDQRFGILKVAINRLDSVCDTGFLMLRCLVRIEMTYMMMSNSEHLPFEFGHQEPLLFLSSARCAWLPTRHERKR